MPKLNLKTQILMATVRPARSGRQARSREVYNPLLSWSVSNRGVHTRAVRFDQ
jgi:hypothetical protein